MVTSERLSVCTEASIIVLRQPSQCVLVAAGCLHDTRDQHRYAKLTKSDISQHNFTPVKGYIMKFFSTWLLASTLVTFSVSGFNNYRPYISTNLAKVIMADKEEVVEEKCDGSGWITHGDGHKTECTGCAACGKGDLSSQVKTKPTCKTVNRFRPIKALLEIFR